MIPHVVHFNVGHVVSTLHTAEMIHRCKQIIGNVRDETCCVIIIVQRSNVRGNSWYFAPANEKSERYLGEIDLIKTGWIQKISPAKRKYTDAHIPVGQKRSHVQVVFRKRHKVFNLPVLSSVKTLQVQTQNTRQFRNNMLLLGQSFSSTRRAIDRICQCLWHGEMPQTALHGQLGRCR
jgi:hypothetical protein